MMDTKYLKREIRKQAFNGSDIDQIERFVRNRFSDEAWDDRVCTIALCMILEAMQSRPELSAKKKICSAY